MTQLSRIGCILLLVLHFLAPIYGQEASATPPNATPANENPAATPAEDVKFRVSADPRPDATSVHESAAVDYSYVGGSTTKAGNRDLGNLSEQDTSINTSFRIPIDETFSVILRAGYQRFDFSSLQSGADTPQNLQSFQVGAGLGYQVDPQWQVIGLFTPSIQEVNDSGGYIHYGGLLAANYHWNDELTIGFGLGINPGGLNNLPVLPVLTLRWHFADPWTLNVGVPRSSLDYALTEQLHLWAGPSFTGGEFRTSSSYGSSVGNNALNSQKFEYQEIRLGFGTDYKINPAITLLGEVGSSLYRDFYFHDADYRPHSDPAPYAQVGVRVAF